MPWRVMLYKTSRFLTSGIGLTLMAILTIIFALLITAIVILARIDNKSDEIIHNARNNTEILCNFIVAHDLRGSEQGEVQDIESICNAEIERLRDAQDGVN